MNPSPARALEAVLRRADPERARHARVASLGALLLAMGLATSPRAVLAQAGHALEVRPETLELRVGEVARLEALVRDGDGGLVADAVVIFVSTDPSAVSVTPDGRVTAHVQGRYDLIALLPADLETAPDLLTVAAGGVRRAVPVRISSSPLTRIEIAGTSETALTGATIPLSARAVDAAGGTRDIRPRFRVDDETLASVATFGELFVGSRNAHEFYVRSRPATFPGDAAALLTTLRPGRVTILAEADGIVGRRDLVIVENPVRTLEIDASAGRVRTGDVVHFTSQARDAGGSIVAAPPLRYAISARPDPHRAESLGAGAAAQILDDGRFVAEQPGIYTVVAMSGDAVARRSVEVVERNVEMDVEVLGHARLADSPTSDLWVWEGIDGRDYAVVGSWNGAGNAFFYDVTDPTDMRLVDTVQVDARTVNDVKVSADGRVAVLTREGASNRRNGLVILDVSEPRDVRVLAQFDDELTGGVHNVFIHDGHVYAINNGRRWDVINIEDPTNPTRVARFEAAGARRSVHDVWVRDGVAYQAGNSDGLILVDVGGGGRGGSPSRPVQMGNMPQLTGWNHAVWPFRSPSAGRLYVVAGDEAHPTNPRIPGPIIAWEERAASRAMGWLHFIEFDDLEHPREVARYRVPDAGPHNLWIDWDAELMYVAYFNGGLRVVDVSGALVGDLFRQGRQVARFFSDDPAGFVANAPFVWGPQPHKGTIFFSDFHSGLWAIRLVARE